MRVESVEINALSADPGNARRHPERNVEAVVASLRRFGQQKPIVIDANNVVRAGNGTLAAAKSLGWTHVDCVRSELAVNELAAYAVADNRTAELAEWDPEGLGAVLDSLDEAGLRELAFDDPAEVAKLLGRPLEEPAGEEQLIASQFEVVVSCRDEAHQQAVYEKLTADGEDCRVLTM